MLDVVENPQSDVAELKQAQSFPPGRSSKWQIFRWNLKSKHIQKVCFGTTAGTTIHSLFVVFVIRMNDYN